MKCLVENVQLLLLLLACCSKNIQTSLNILMFLSLFLSLNQEKNSKFWVMKTDLSRLF